MKFPPKLVAIWLISTVVVALIIILVIGIYKTRDLRAENTKLSAELADLRSAISRFEEENSRLRETVVSQENTTSEYRESIGKIENTIQTLNKWQSLDPELLSKYSKVFFLSENYVPALLTNIDKSYLANSDKSLLFQAEAWPFLQALLRSAQNDGSPIQVISAFRSFDSQSSLKSNYTVTYGTGANKFSADQGYSEHQLGTAVDFSTPELGTNFTKFGATDAYKWLNSNAYKYGFILSYPENNSYYVFEPWHWRFVGISLATKLREENKRFYDLEQRELDGYLLDIFDQSRLPS